MKINAIRTLALALAFTAPAIAQDKTAPGSIHGTVTNDTGVTANKGEIRLTLDRAADVKNRKFPYTFPIGPDGKFKGDGIAPGDYVLIYFVGDQSADFLEHVIIKPGQDTLADDDLTREEFQKTLTPERKKQIEEFKKQNAAVTQSNKTVANLNQLLTKARDEEKNKQWDAAIADMTQATTQKPDEALLWLELGQSQLGKAKDEKDLTARTGELNDSVTSFQKAVDMNTASKKPLPQLAGVAYSGLGEAEGRLNKTPDAAAAYDKAAAADPTKAGTFYFNEAAIFSNAGNSDAATAAADKAIAADPTKPEPYYIKGQSLVGKSTTDAKSGKIVPPPGCLEAYSKYLELAPNGPYAPTVKEIISAFDEKVVSSYKASKKR